jgi:hypothetical protein
MPVRASRWQQDSKDIGHSSSARQAMQSSGEFGIRLLGRREEAIGNRERAGGLPQARELWKAARKR